MMSVDERYDDTNSGWAFICKCDRCLLERKLEKEGHFTNFKRFAVLSQVDEILKIPEGEAVPSDLSQILLENY